MGWPPGLAQSLASQFELIVYDPVALAVLVFGIAAIEMLALSI